MSKNRWDLEFAGAGILSGDFVSAEYEHTPAGWAIRYLVGGDVVATSAAPRHPSLGKFGADAAGEKRVVKAAFGVIDSLEAGVYEQARRGARKAAHGEASCR